MKETDFISQILKHPDLAGGPPGEFIKKHHPEDIAAALNNIDEPDKLLRAVYSLPEGVDSLVIPFLEVRALNLIIENSPPEKIGEIIEEMESDDAADVLGNVREEVAEDILETVSEEWGKRISHLMEYGAQTAGGVMKSEVFTMPVGSTVDETIGRLRRMAGLSGDTHNVFVVDPGHRLAGVFPSSALLFAPPGARVESLVTDKPQSVTAETDQEDVARIFKKYDLITLPVLDSAGVLLGAVTVDDVVDIMEAEAGEDILRMAGAGDESTVRTASSLKLAWLRAPWLGSSMAAGGVTGIAMWQFSPTINSMVALATFIPMVMGLTGNVGTQSSALVIRGIATGRLNSGSRRRYIFKEMKVAILLAFLCSTLCGAVAYLWQESVIVGASVGGALFISVVLASVTGTLIPLLFRWLKLDPAIAGGPLTLALNDIIALVLYLGIATALLNVTGV
ncbi:MAG: magnesium transporter [Nitrospinae bacterium]|nr:magnesium transporter [Nitrospinota bacterium]